MGLQRTGHDWATFTFIQTNVSGYHIGQCRCRPSLPSWKVLLDSTVLEQWAGLLFDLLSFRGPLDTTKLFFFSTKLFLNEQVRIPVTSNDEGWSKSTNRYIFYSLESSNASPLWFPLEEDTAIYFSLSFCLPLRVFSPWFLPGTIPECPFYPLVKMSNESFPSFPDISWQFQKTH